MDGIRQYLLSVSAASVICAVLTVLAGKKGTAPQMVKLLCGLFLALTVIRPLASVKLEAFAVYTESIAAEAEEAVAVGENMASEELESIIKSKTQAYILDKAEALEVDVEVEVLLDDGMPAGVYLRGDAAPYAKQHLTSWIADILGIPREAQEWIG